MEQIISYLKYEIESNLKSNIPLKKNILDWIEKGRKTKNIDLQRFLICLAIDLKSMLISFDDVLKIFSEIPFYNKSLNYVSEFDKIISANITKWYCNSNCSDKEFGKEKYSVIVYWSKVFRKYIKKKEMSGMPVSLNQEDKIHSDFFKEKTKSLKDIQDWSGWKRIVWLLPSIDLMSDVEKINKTFNSNHKSAYINKIIDKAGLNPPNASPSISFANDQLLYIEYPDECHINCYQPTVLSGYWIEPGGLYLSFIRETGYGKTFSTSGKDYSNKERVHIWEDIDHSSYQLFTIGFPDGTLKKNLSKKIIVEGLSRFDRC